MDIQKVNEFVNWKPPINPNIIGSDLLPLQARMILYGREKSFKSMVAMHTGFCVASGQQWLGHDCKKSNTLYIQTEISKFSFHQRMIKYIHGNGIAVKDLNGFYVATEFGLKIDTPYGIQQVEKAIAEHKIELLILDPMYKLVSGDINSGYEVMRALNNLDALIGKFGISIIIVNHTRKQQMVEGQYVSLEDSEDISGSKNFANWCDTAVRIARTNDTPQDSFVSMKFTTLRHAVYNIKPVDLKITRNSLAFCVVKKNKEFEDEL